MLVISLSLTAYKYNEQSMNVQSKPKQIYLNTVDILSHTYI